MDSNKVARNSIVGMLANGFYLISRLLLTPFILVHVSLEEFGLWSFCFVIISFAGLSGTGISSAFIKFTAEFHARDEEEKISEILTVGTLVLAFLSIVIFAGVWFFTPLLLEIFAIKSPEMQELATFLIRGSVVVFLFDLVLSGFKSLLDGLQEIALSRIVWLASTLIEVGLTVTLLSFGWGIRGVFWGYVARLFAGTACYIFLAARKIKIRFRLSFAALKLLFSFGGKVQILSFIGIFMTSFDRLVITRMLGLDFAGLFEIGRKFPLMGASVTAGALDSLLPASSAMQNGNHHALPVRRQWQRYGQVLLLALLLGGALAVAWPIHEWQKTMLVFTDPQFMAFFFLGLVTVFALAYYLLKNLLTSDCLDRSFSPEVKELYLRGSFYLNLLNALLFSFLCACSPKIILAWVGRGYEEAVWVMSILAVSVLVNLTTGPGTALLRGAGQPECELEYALLNLILAICWIPVLAHFLELPGAALGTAASTIMASLYFNFRTNRIFNISFFEYAERAIFPALAPIASSILVGVALFFLTTDSRWVAILQVVTAGILYLIFNFFLLKKLTVFTEEFGPIWETIKRWKYASWRRGQKAF